MASGSFWRLPYPILGDNICSPPRRNRQIILAVHKETSMKIISIYVLFAVLTLTLIVIIDVMSGISLRASIHSLSTIFATTTLQEAICITIFLLLPFVQVAVHASKKRQSRRKPS